MSRDQARGRRFVSPLARLSLAVLWCASACGTTHRAFAPGGTGGGGAEAGNGDAGAKAQTGAEAGAGEGGQSASQAGEGGAADANSAGAAGVAAQPKVPGEACFKNEDCASSSCRDAVCCDSTCDGACEACRASSTGKPDGICAPLASSSLQSDASNCGSCGHVCPDSIIPEATATCTRGVCGAACPPGTLGDGVNLCVPVTTLAAGDKFTCGLLATGKVSCWGELSGGIDPAAAGVDSFNFLSLSGQGSQVCGIRDTGQIVCWGATATTHAGTYVALATADQHSCAIMADQTLECWSSDQDSVIEAEPTGKYKGIASMNHFSCAIIAGGAQDGKLKCWGDSTDYDFRAPPGADTFTRVVGGSQHACGIKGNGTITCWGYLSYPSFPASTVFKTLGYGGATHYCGILADDTIFCWGADGGEGGPAASGPSGTFRAVALGGNHTCGVTTAGRVVCSGNDSWGQSANQPGPFF